MMAEHFESWYATLDTSLRNMVEGGLVATVCGWFGATVFATLAALAWVRGRLRAARAVVTAKEAEPGSVAAMTVAALRGGKRVWQDDGMSFNVGPLNVKDRLDGTPRVWRRVGGGWEDLRDTLSNAEWELVRAAAEDAWRAHVAEVQEKARRELESAAAAPEPTGGAGEWKTYHVPGDDGMVLKVSADPESTPEPCPPPLSPLASVLLELLACGGVSPDDDGRGFKVGALCVSFDRSDIRLTYPVGGKPADLMALLPDDADVTAVRKAARAAWGQSCEAAAEKARERAVAAIRAQVAVFRGEQPKKNPVEKPDSPWQSIEMIPPGGKDGQVLVRRGGTLMWEDMPADTRAYWVPSEPVTLSLKWDENAYREMLEKCQVAVNG
jgi:hypothetical protein